MALSPVAAFAQTNSPSAADGFDPDIDGTVFTLATQADGKILVGGTFTTVKGASRTNLARLNFDGSVDPSFNLATDGKVTSLVIQADGNILIGGYFTTLTNGSGVATTRNRIARVSPAGVVDATFNPNLSGFLAPGVEAIAVQTDGKILVGGTFTSAQPNGAATPTTRNRLARFNADGTLDTSFDPNVDRTVLSIALQADGSIIIGGGFTTITPAGSDAVIRNGIARLSASGLVDASYDPNANNGVTKVLVQPDGKVVAGGYFTAITPNGYGVVNAVSHLIRLNTDGTSDIGFNPGVSGNVTALALERNGGILVGGLFSTVSSARRGNVARLNPDGTLDVNFNPNVNSAVYAVLEEKSNTVLVGGNFTQAQPNFATAATTRNKLARFNPDGTVDADFNPDTNGRVLAVQLQSDGKALVGGSFSSIGGVTRTYLARLNTDGSLDTAFNPNLNGLVSAIAVQGDGKIIVGGGFTLVNGIAKQHMVRLNTDGSVDASFEPNPDNFVSSLAIQSDNKIIVGGYFLNVRPNGSASYIQRSYLCRFNADGSLDSDFNPVAGGPVLALVIQTDKKIIVGGNFLGFASGNRANIARLNIDGTLDPNYNPSADKQVNAVVLQSDGKIVIGGSFTFLQPTNAPVVDITTTNSDGTVTKSKTTTSFRRGIARINVDGTVDPTYDPSTDNVVRTLALQADGKVIAGGLFHSLTPNSETTPLYRNFIARINTDGTLDTGFDLGVNDRIGNQVITLAIQSDKKIILGGAFNSLQPAGGSLVVRNQLARVTVDGAVDATYAPNTGGPTGAVINSLTTQSDGRVLVGGSFTGFGGALSSNLARFNSESVPDAFFNPNPNGPVNAVATRLIGGSVGTQLNNFAWLLPNGSLRTAFVPPANTLLSGTISAIAVQSDGKILLGGAITDLTSRVSGNLVRLNPDGSLDTTFSPIIDSTVSSIAIQSDGNIVIGGSFVTVDNTSRQYIARLLPDGTLDANFNPSANAAVNVVKVQSDGYILLGGAFTSIQPNGATNSSPINYLARVKPDGTYDNAFNPNPNSSIYSIALQDDGGIVIGGAFTTVIASNGSTTVLNRSHVARLKADGSVDTTFDPGASGPVYALGIQSDGKVVLGGSFGFLQANGSATIISRNNLARVNADGSLDTSFDPNPNSAITTIAVQTDGKIVFGGLFTSLQPPGATNATTRNYLARVNADGSIDTSFDPNFNGSVSAMALQADGSLLVSGIFNTIEPLGSLVVGGSFTSIGGANVSNLALLTTGGAVSGSYAPNPNGTVYALAVRPDNRVVVAGAFSTIAGASRSGVAQLAADGSLDSTFNSGASATGGQAVLLLQSDGKLLVGGAAVGFSGTAHGTLERLNADGSLDAAFNPSGLGVVNALALQADGKILVGGAAPGQLVRLNANGTTDASFTAAPNGTVNSISIQSDGSIVVGGAFTSIGGASVPYLARLLAANGAADTTFQPAVNGTVSATMLTTGGKVLFGGGFSAVGALPRYGLARVSSTSPAAQNLVVDSGFTTVTWTRTGSSPTLNAALFEKSSDGRNWTTLGAASRVGTADTWQLSGQSLANSAGLFVRARGSTVTSQYSSAGVTETVLAIYGGTLPVTPQILSATTANGTSGSSFYYSILTNLSGATFGASGLPAGLTIDPASGLITGSTTAVGTYVVTLTATTSSGTATATLTLTISAPGSGPSVVRFLNLSSRAQVTPTDPLIAGLVISGTTSQTVLLRAIGPGLADFGVTGIGHPHLQLYDNGGALLGENSGWGGSAALSAVFTQVGAFPLNAANADAALLVTLAPGRYSVVVTDTTGATGVALAEVYDTGTDSSATAPRLVNISSRATADTGANTLIGGFVVSGSAPKRILIRGIGPTLAGFGVSSAMANPILGLYDSGGVLIAQNDDWETPVTITAGQPGASAAAIVTATAQAGAFALASGTADSAIIVNLPPGTYSAQVKSVSGATGTALVEIYELP